MSAAGAVTTGRPGRAERPAAGRERLRAWAAVAVVCAALFLIGLDFTVLNVAIPGLRADLGTSLAQTQWIVDGYALTLGGCVLAAGTLGDTYGRRRAFVAGLAVCALASVAGATGDGAGQLIAARCGMGVGAALFMPATLSTVVHVLPGAADRRRAISLWAAVAGVGALAGPVVGGRLVLLYEWRAAFWLNVPVAVLVAAAALLLVPESRNPAPERLDRPGAVLSCAGLLTLVWGIIEAPGRGWTDGAVLAAFAASAVLLGGFAARQLCSAAPMLPPALLRRGPVGLATLSLALMSFAMFGAMFVLTLYLQQVRGLDAWAAGVRTIPFSVGLAVGAGAAPPLARRCGARVPVTAGLLLITSGFAVLAGLRPGAGEAPVLLFQALAGFGSGLVAPVATEVVMSAVPAANAGVGSALNDATRQVGSTLGVAVLGSVLAEVSTGELPPGSAAALVLSGGGPDLAGAGPDLAEAVRQAETAFVHGMTAAAWTGGAVALLAAVFAWRRMPRRQRPAAAPVTPAPARGLVPGPER
ncbi:MFS transporter [Kitasatospora herbaricolor]|uniref:MFS transporter n=1 Tax=Kitasatospora herbaricolor TaxID=68217 RepID=A0ABZ1W5K9_9ACTN|nr:MFS transporter [Kitasatospora herbaricolor]